jgi:hypothetical protein
VIRTCDDVTAHDPPAALADDAIDADDAVDVPEPDPVDRDDDALVAWVAVVALAPVKLPPVAAELDEPDAIVAEPIVVAEPRVAEAPSGGERGGCSELPHPGARTHTHPSVTTHDPDERRARSARRQPIFPLMRTSVATFAACVSAR